MADLLAGVEAAAGLAVHGGSAASARRELVEAGIPGRLAGKDPTLWGTPAESSAPHGLGWVDAYRRGRELLPQIAELCAELGDLDEVVVAGPARAASAITRTLGVPMTVLNFEPPRLRDAVADPDRLSRSVVVLTGGDEVLRGVFWQALLDAGRTAAEAGRHFVVVGGEPFQGAVTIPADPDATGPWAALSASALVPAALAGVDMAELLDEAELLAPSLSATEDNPALALGVALGTAEGTVALRADGTGLEGLGEWAAELLDGIVPAVVDAPGDITVSYGGSLLPGAVPGGGVRPDVAINGPLGAQFLAWQYAAAIAAVMRIRNPFAGH
jgi:glucose-6-phosphate isomerase